MLHWNCYETNITNKIGWNNKSIYKEYVKSSVCIIIAFLEYDSVRNSFWKCPAETSGQNNILPASCGFCLENDYNKI